MSLESSPFSDTSESSKDSGDTKSDARPLRPLFPLPKPESFEPPKASHVEAAVPLAEILRQTSQAEALSEQKPEQAEDSDDDSDEEEAPKSAAAAEEATIEAPAEPDSGHHETTVMFDASGEQPNPEADFEEIMLE